MTITTSKANKKDHHMIVIYQNNKKSSNLRISSRLSLRKDLRIGGVRIPKVMEGLNVKKDFAVVLLVKKEWQL